MSRRVLAYHLILTTYGFWLPNDPRGSGSDYVRSPDLYRIGGPATKVTTRHSVAHHSHDRTKRLQAKSALERPPVKLDGLQARSVINGVHDYLTATRRPCFAAAIMPDHLHVVLGRGDATIETIATQLKARTTLFLNRANLHPLREHPRRDDRIPTPWAAGCWKVFLSDQAHLRSAIRYVENNPMKAGHRPQHYPWVVPLTA